MSGSTFKDKDKMQDLGTVMFCSMAEMGETHKQPQGLHLLQHPAHRWYWCPFFWVGWLVSSEKCKILGNLVV